MVYITSAKSLSVITAIYSIRDYILFRSCSALFGITSKTFKVVLQYGIKKICCIFAQQRSFIRILLISMETNKKEAEKQKCDKYFPLTCAYGFTQNKFSCKKHVYIILRSCYITKMTKFIMGPVWFRHCKNLSWNKWNSNVYGNNGEKILEANSLNIFKSKKKKKVKIKTPELCFWAPNERQKPKFRAGRPGCSLHLAQRCARQIHNLLHCTKLLNPLWWIGGALVGLHLTYHMHL